MAFQKYVDFSLIGFGWQSIVQAAHQQQLVLIHPTEILESKIPPFSWRNPNK
jgi:hypothetical protein